MKRSVNLGESAPGLSTNENNFSIGVGYTKVSIEIK
jgi:hypothetical protein